MLVLNPKYLIQIAVVFAAQFAAGKLGDILQSGSNGGIGPVWPAAGVALAALLLWDYSVWPGVAAGAFLLAFLSPLPYWATVVYAAGTTLGALVGAFLLRRIGFDKSLSRLRDAVALLTLGAFGSSIVSASIGAAVLYAAHFRGWSGFGSAWLVYWFGDSTGVAVVTPLVLTFPSLLRIRNQDRLKEYAVLLLLLTTTTLIIFGDLHLIPIRLHVLAFGVLALVMWSAIRFWVGATCLSIFLVATIATVATALGSGPFVANAPFSNAVLLDIFFAVLSLTGLVLATLCAEKERAHREREQLVSNQVAMEVRLEATKVLRVSEERWRLAAKAGKMYAYDWDVETDVIVRSGEIASVLGQSSAVLSETNQQMLTRVHPDDRALFVSSLTERTPENPDVQISFRMLRPDGSLVWLERTSHAFFDERGRIVRMIGMVADITQRKHAEQGLKESEMRFRLLADTAPVLIWMSGTDKLHTYFNKPWLDFTGQSFGKQYGNGWVEGVHPDDLQRCLATYTQSFDQRAKFTMEYRLRRHDGEYRWILDNGVPRFNPDSSFAGYIGTALDVTERKMAEEALRASEERLRLAQQAARIGTFERNIETGVTSWTTEMETMYGLPPGEFGQTRTAFEKLIHPDDRAQVIELINWALKTGEPTQGEWRVTWPDRSIHWISGRWQVLMNKSGQPSRVVGVNIDITQRKLAEQKLREYERVVENSEDMIAMVDQEYRYLIANRQYLKMRNMTREQVVGRFVREVLNDGGFEAVVKPKLDECFQGNTVRYEMKRSHPELGERDVCASYFPIEGTNGVDRVACILQDITDRKQAEEALAGMSRKLIEAQEQERTRIARDLHDDIAQRLAVLAIELVQLKQNLPNSPGELRVCLNALGERTAQISTDVQTMSHELHSSKLEYLGLVAAMRGFCKEFAGRQKAEVDFRSYDLPSPLLPEVSLCLFRVLQEALQNAIKHSGVRHFEVQLRGEAGAIHLIVSDSGRGFDIESAMRGQGLGLISMRERVRLVNGTIVIESRPLNGTSIHARVPFTCSSQSARAAG